MMQDSIILGLLHNIAILLAFSMLYIHFWSEDSESKRHWLKIVSGLIVGAIGIILMLTPWTLVPGIVFDTRSILLSVTGLFFGFLPTTIAVIIASIFRIYLGGAGVAMGVSVIISSGAIGILWHYYRKDWQSKNYMGELLALGLFTHLAMTAMVIFLPTESIWPTFRHIVGPVMIIYPLGTVLLGVLMAGQKKNMMTRQALRDKEESYKRLYESMKDAYAMVDLSGNIIEFNPSFREMMGYTDEELLGKSYKEITPKRWHAMEDRRVMLEVLPNGSSDAYEKELIRKDGSHLPVEIRTFALKDKLGEMKAMWAIVRDISGRKHTEKELILSKNKAEENNRLKSIFLANMSHEIRTPMNSIMGFSSMLAKDVLDPEKRDEFLKIINGSGNRLLQIIDDIVDISKLEAGQLSVQYSEGKLFDLVSNSVASFRNSELMQRRPQVNLSLLFPEEYREMHFRTDFIRVQQVLDNLISNALKYTREGTVEVNLMNEEASGMLRFSVRDTGCGIPRSKQDIVFERFRQIEEHGYREGTGLGLSISKGIVELLGGKIWFHSTAGSGSTFFFTIPFSVAGEAEKPVPPAPLNEKLLKGKSVIIAEDDPSSYIYLKELLTKHEAIITHAPDGRVLMELLSAGIPDLIFLDINMPEKTGYECLREMAKLGIKAKVIAQTAYAMTDERDKCLNAGCNGYISKPIVRSEMEKVIRKVLYDN